jgi:UDP-N-acetylmuramyl pentapeptide synthase
MVFEYYLLLILSILPIIYKYSFWLFTIQLKEYRLDRLKEYLTTKQWKSAILNIWTIFESALILFWLIIFFNKPFEVINYNILFYFLVMYNLFVIWKILRKWIITPIITWRIIIIVFLLTIWFSIDVYYLIYWWFNNWIYFYIPFILLSAPIIIWFYNLISLPIVNHKKKALINKAIGKSNKFNNPIKIWITWSYWKSSVKEFLSSILEQDWKTLKTPDNINTELWVSSLIINKLSNDYKYFVAEMWAYKIWEIDLLWKIVNHKYWFLTAIWNQHMAMFWSQENINNWKSEIQNSILKNNWTLYINWNNSNIQKTKFNNKLNIVKYWNTPSSDAKYKIIHINDWVIEFNFQYKEINTNFKTKLIWEHNVLNITWIIAFCYDIWLKTLKLKEYIEDLQNPKNILNIIKNKTNIFIDDSYNLSENWLYSWLTVLNSFKWNKILVLDDILELWKESNIIHYNIWKSIAQKKQIDQILLSWKNYKDEFIKWLLEWWFDKKNILNSLKNIENNNIILLEWRNSWKYLIK